jgi:hypothetical protein
MVHQMLLLSIGMKPNYKMAMRELNKVMNSISKRAKAGEDRHALFNELQLNTIQIYKKHSIEYNAIASL